MRVCTIGNAFTPVEQQAIALALGYVYTHIAHRSCRVHFRLMVLPPYIW